MGTWVVSKIPSLSLRASGFALSPWAAGGIFDTTLAPIWYFYNILDGSFLNFNGILLYFYNDVLFGFPIYEELLKIVSTLMI